MIVENDPLLVKQSSAQSIGNQSIKQQSKLIWNQDDVKKDWEDTLDPELKLIKGKSAMDGAGCCSRFFFFWAKPFLRVSTRHPPYFSEV